MHHVAISLKSHQFVDLHRAELGNPTDIIACKINQHDVFGALFGVFRQLSGHPSIVVVGAPTTPGAMQSGDEITLRSSSCTIGSGEEPTIVSSGCFT